MALPDQLLINALQGSGGFNLSTNWLRDGQPQQNLPWDDVPGSPSPTNPPPGFEGPALPGSSRPAIPFWDAAPEGPSPTNNNFSPWDVLKLGSYVLPGLCAVTGRRGVRWDVKPSKGINFATITRQGFDLAEIKVVERIWTPQQLAALYSLIPILEDLNSSPEATIQAVKVEHPALALRNITDVVIKHITLLHPSSVKGVWEQEIELSEYKPRGTSNVTETVRGSSAQFARASPGTQVQPAAGSIASPGSGPSTP